jgi:hypothetical protein
MNRASTRQERAGASGGGRLLVLQRRHRRGRSAGDPLAPRRHAPRQARATVSGGLEAWIAQIDANGLGVEALVVAMTELKTIARVAPVQGRVDREQTVRRGPTPRQGGAGAAAQHAGGRADLEARQQLLAAALADLRGRRRPTGGPDGLAITAPGLADAEAARKIAKARATIARCLTDRPAYPVWIPGREAPAGEGVMGATLASIGHLELAGREAIGRVLPVRVRDGHADALALEAVTERLMTRRAFGRAEAPCGPPRTQRRGVRPEADCRRRSTLLVRLAWQTSGEGLPTLEPARDEDRPRPEAARSSHLALRHRGLGFFHAQPCASRAYRWGDRRDHRARRLPSDPGEGWLSVLRGFLIRDDDDKFGVNFDRAAKGAGIRVLRTAVRALRAAPAPGAPGSSCPPELRRRPTAVARSSACRCSTDSMVVDAVLGTRMSVVATTGAPNEKAG